MKNSYLKFMVVYLLAVGCNSIQPSEHEKKATPLKRNEDAFKVNFVKATSELLVVPVEASGKLEAARIQTLSFQTSGLLDELFVKNGQRIKKGQRIATLSNRLQTIQYQEAQLSYRQALYQDEDERMFLSDSSFYKGKWSEVDEKTGLKSGVPQAKLALDKAAINLDHTKLIAPFDGVVSGLTAQSGDYVSANQSIVTLYDPDNLEITVNLLEYDFSKVKVGQQATMKALAIENRPFDGRILDINPSVDASGHFTARIQVDSDTQGLVPGMSATVSIATSGKNESIIVPLKAVVNRSGRQVVFTHEDGLAKWNYVTLGNQNGELVEVLEGIGSGSEVIISDVFQLAHDSPVIAEPASESSTAL